LYYPTDTFHITLLLLHYSKARYFIRDIKYYYNGLSHTILSIATKSSFPLDLDLRVYLAMRSIMHEWENCTGRLSTLRRAEYHSMASFNVKFMLKNVTARADTPWNPAGTNDIQAIVQRLC